MGSGILKLCFRTFAMQSYRGSAENKKELAAAPEIMQRMDNVGSLVIKDMRAIKLYTQENV